MRKRALSSDIRHSRPKAGFAELQGNDTSFA